MGEARTEASHTGCAFLQSLWCYLSKSLASVSFSLNEYEILSPRPLSFAPHHEEETCLGVGWAAAWIPIWAPFLLDWGLLPSSLLSTSTSTVLSSWPPASFTVSAIELQVTPTLKHNPPLTPAPHVPGRHHIFSASLIHKPTCACLYACGLLSLLSRCHQDFNSPFIKHLSPWSSTTAPHPPLPPTLTAAGYGKPRMLPGLLLAFPEHHHVLLALGWEEGRLLPTGQLVHEGRKGRVLHLAHHRQGQWSLRERGPQRNEWGSLTTKWVPTLSSKLRVLNQEEVESAYSGPNRNKKPKQLQIPEINPPSRLGHHRPWQFKTRWSGEHKLWYSNPFVQGHTVVERIFLKPHLLSITKSNLINEF